MGEVPRDYNFAADVLQRNLDAGRADKPAYIDGTAHADLSASSPTGWRVSAPRCAGSGLHREERVLMALLDTVDWPTAFLGCLKAGIVAVPVNTLLTEDDYRFMLADSRAKCLVVSEALFPKFEKLIAESPDLEHVIVSGDNPHGYRLFEDVIGADEPEEYTAPTTADDMAFWLYTSGSTGKPKGAVHVHASLKLTADLYGTPIAGFKESDVCLFGGETVLRLRSRQCHDLSAHRRRHHRAQSGTADAGRRRGAVAQTSGHAVLRGADLLCRLPGEPERAGADRR